MSPITGRCPRQRREDLGARESAVAPLVRAATSSTLSLAIAGDHSTTSGRPTFAASCPTATVTPERAQRFELRPSPARSLPLTTAPDSTRSRASPLMPAPPTPTMWTRHAGFEERHGQPPTSATTWAIEAAASRRPSVPAAAAMEAIVSGVVIVASTSSRASHRCTRRRAPSARCPPRPPPARSSSGDLRARSATARARRESRASSTRPPWRHRPDRSPRHRAPRVGSCRRTRARDSRVR